MSTLPMNPYFTPRQSAEEANAARLERRRQMALELIKQSQQQQPQGEMIGGGGGDSHFGARPAIYVAPSMLEQIAPVVAGGLGASQLDKVDKEAQSAAMASDAKNQGEWSDATQSGFNPNKAIQSSDPELRRAALKYYLDQPEIEARKAEKEAARTYAETKEAQRIAERTADNERQQKQYDETKSFNMAVHNDNKAETRAGRQFAVDNRAPPNQFYFGTTTDANGNQRLTAVNKQDPSKTIDVAAGTPTASQQKAAVDRSAKITAGLTNLDLVAQAEKLVGKGTSSGVGSIRDQIASQFGISTEAGDAAAQLNVIGGNLMLNTPRFEGPQSDKDAAVYKQMAGDIGNPKIPVSQKAAALKTIKQLNQKYGKAPQAAIDHLKTNPQLAEQFKAKYGYLP